MKYWKRDVDFIEIKQDWMKHSSADLFWISCIFASIIDFQLTTRVTQLRIDYIAQN